MTPSIRKFALTVHVTSSVGWLGAVGGFLALAIAGLTSANEHIVRATYLAMELTGWCVIVPLSFASLLTGVVQSLGTTWGLFRHYWVVAKLLITVVASILLLVHMQIADWMASAAADMTLLAGDFRGLRIQLVADAAAAVLVLLVATALSVFKPQGLTPFGRKQLGEPGTGSSNGTPRWARLVGIIVIAVVVLFLIVKHLTGGGLGHHH